MSKIVTNLDFINMAGPRAIFFTFYRPCNLACKFCYEKYTLMKENTTDEEIDDTLEKLKDFKLRDNDYLHLDRTEMTLDDTFYILEKTLKAIREQNNKCIIKIYTNGYGLTLDKYEKLEKYNPYYVVAIDTDNVVTRMTKDGKSIKNIVDKNLIDITKKYPNQKNISVRYVITYENYFDVVPSALRLNKDTGIRIFSFNPDGTVEDGTDKELRHLNKTKNHIEIYDSKMINKIENSMNDIYNMMVENRFELDRPTLVCFVSRYGQTECLRDVQYIPNRFTEMLLKYKWDLVRKLDKRKFWQDIIINIGKYKDLRDTIDIDFKFDKNTIQIAFNNKEYIEEFSKDTVLEYYCYGDKLIADLKFDSLSWGRGAKNVIFSNYKIKGAEITHDNY